MSQITWTYKWQAMNYFSNTGTHTRHTHKHRDSHSRDTRKQLSTKFGEKSAMKIKWKIKRKKKSHFETKHSHKANQSTKNVRGKTAAFVHFNKYYFIIQRARRNIPLARRILIYTNANSGDVEIRTKKKISRIVGGQRQMWNRDCSSSKPNERTTTSLVAFRSLYLFLISRYLSWVLAASITISAKSECVPCVYMCVRLSQWRQRRPIRHWLASLGVQKPRIK